MIPMPIDWRSRNAIQPQGNGLFSRGMKLEPCWDTGCGNKLEPPVKRYDMMCGVFRVCVFVLSSTVFVNSFILITLLLLLSL